MKSRKVELDPQVSPEEIMSREVGLGCESWTSFASSCSSTAVQRTLSLWLPSTAVETSRGHRLNTQFPLFWRRSTVSPVFFGWYPRSSLHSFVLSVSSVGYIEAKQSKRENNFTLFLRSIINKTKDLRGGGKSFWQNRLCTTTPPPPPPVPSI